MKSKDSLGSILKTSFPKPWKSKRNGSSPRHNKLPNLGHEDIHNLNRSTPQWTIWKLSVSQKESPRPGRCTNKFYQTFQSFKPLLTQLHSIQRKGPLPNTLKSGITLTPKQGKDTTTRETTWNQFPRAISKQKFLTKFLQTKHHLIGFISRYKFGSAYRIWYVQYGCKHTFS